MRGFFTDMFTIKGLMVLFAVVSSYALQAIELKDSRMADSVLISSEQQQQIRQMKLTAAMVWHGSSPWIQAVTAGANKEFADLGIKVLAVTDAQFDPARQVADLENITVLNPDLILSLVVDPTSAKTSYSKVVQQGAKLVLLSNPIPGFVLHKDYVGIVTDDMFGMGKQAAVELSAHFNQSARIGMIFHDADYFITNSRDKAFRQQLAQYPQLQLVAEKGFVREQETSQVAAALILQHPDLDAIYVSWDAAAEGVIEALRLAGRKDIKVITHDLGVNNLLDMAMKGNMLATISDQPFVIGSTMARLAALSKLGQQAAPYTLVPFMTVTADNIAPAWQQSFRNEVPALLQQVLKP